MKEDVAAIQHKLDGAWAQARIKPGLLLKKKDTGYRYCHTKAVG